MTTKLASRLPIQQMIASVLNSATEKVAQDQTARNQKVKDLISYEKREHGHIPTPSEEETEKKASAAPEYVEKLASAVEYIATHMGEIEFPQRGVLQKAAEHGGSPQGAGKGEGALKVMEAIGGEQNHDMGQAHDIEASSSKAHSPLSGSHERDGKTQLDNNMHNAPGGGGLVPTAKYPAKGPLVAGPSAGGHHSKEKAAAALRQAVLRKLAGEDVMKANIEAERSANPLAGMGQLESFDATQPAPHQAGDETGGSGNQGRRLISSNQAAIDATKRDAKGPVKTQLSELLDEPALNSGTDPVLQHNLQNTGSAGVKIAAARTALEKVAQQGCTCETIDGECAYDRLVKAAAATRSNRGSTKTANALMGYGGGMSGGSSMAPSSPTMAGGGGGMMSMADAGAGADGCTCGDTGECRICKLKAALAAARAQGGGNGMSGPMPNMPVDKDTQGAAPAGTY
jgi:hypothetical protein